MLGLDEPLVDLALDLELAEGDLRVVPMQPEHAPLLQPWIDGDTDAFHWMLGSPMRFDNDAERWIGWLVAKRALGVDGCLPFTLLHAHTGAFLGYSRYLHIDLPSRTLHVGGTYYVAPARGTQLNALCKRLLLGHAFERANLNRVTIQADVRNRRSCRSIEKLGATFEGVIRAQYLGPDGMPRDTAVYSVIRNEWHEVEERLRALEAAAPPVPAHPRP